MPKGAKLTCPTCGRVRVQVKDEEMWCNGKITSTHVGHKGKRMK